MKVRVNHAIELGDVPVKLSEMISGINNELQEAAMQSDQLESMAHLTSNSPLKYRLMSETLNDLKRIISEAEQSVDDMLSILGGYVNILERDTTTPVPASATQDFAEDPDLKGPDLPESNARLPATNSGAS